MNPQVSNAQQQRKYKNSLKMTTTTGYKVSSVKTKSTPTRASDCVDEASDASLYCGSGGGVSGTQQEPLPTPRAKPRPQHHAPPKSLVSAPTPKPRSGKEYFLSTTTNTYS